jgi:tetratricopeptide (TPR) repeat protein
MSTYLTKMRVKYVFRLLAIFIFLLAKPESSFAQELPFKVIVSEFLDSNTNTNQSLKETFDAFRRDTIKMQHLASQGKINNNLDAAAYANHALGSYFRNKSNYKRAISFYKVAISLAEQSNNTEQEVRSLNSIGVVYRRMDAVRSALDYHQKALNIADEINPKNDDVKQSIAISLNSIGNIYIALRQFDLAEERFKKSLDYEIELNNKRGLAINYQNIGYCYEQREIFDKALVHYRKSMQYNVEINSKLGIAICNNSIGQLYLKQDNPQEALNLIEPTIELSKSLGDNFYIAMATINTGWALTELNRYEEAELRLKEGLSISQKYKLQGFKAEAYKHLSTLMEKQGRYHSALQYYEFYQEEEEKILNLKNQQYMSDLLIKYETEKQQSKIDLLEKENEIVKIKLGQSQRIFLYAALLFLLIVIVAFLLYRQRKLESQKRLLTIEQKLLRTQMNPHFIFNSLLSIKIYMMNNDKESAIEYLNKFSKLVRTILATSLEKEITLAEEIETMNLYVNIENIRLNNEVRYTVQIDKGIALDQVKIPSLTLQPFIENALWHGLSAKEGVKSLSLEVTKQEDNFIEIFITDNGIGRQNTIKIKEDSLEHQKSIGTNLTKERLGNFFRNFKNTHSLSIFDLFDEDQNPSGTKVVLRIPLK